MAQSKKLKSTKWVQLELASFKMLVSPQAKYLRGLGHICVPIGVSRSSILTVGFAPLLYLREHLLNPLIRAWPFPCHGQTVLLHRHASVSFLTQLSVDGMLPHVIGNTLSSGSHTAVSLSAIRVCGQALNLPHQGN